MTHKVTIREIRMIRMINQRRMKIREIRMIRMINQRRMRRRNH
jgi:hypothetical protein